MLNYNILYDTCNNCGRFFFEERGFLSSTDKNALFCCEECAREYDEIFQKEIEFKEELVG